MNYRTLYFHRSSSGDEFYDADDGNRRVWGFALPKLDITRLRLKLTSGTAYSAVSLADQDTMRFSLKTPVHFDAEEDGDLDLTVAGFDTTDSAWHSPGNGKITIQVAAPLSLASGVYIPEFMFVEGSNNWSLTPADYTMVCELTRRVYTGSESNASNDATSLNSWFSGTASAATDFANITVTGMTTTGKVLPVVKSGQGQYITGYTCTTDNVKVQLNADAGAGGVTVEILVKSL